LNRTSQPPRPLLTTYIRELVYGANDGVVTTLAIIAGVVGADLPATVILILGFANLFADGVSMGASNVLAERSRVDDPPTLSEALPFGAATFVGFFVAGIVPLAAYMVPGLSEGRFALAVGLAAVTLFVVGAGRTLVSQRSWLPAGLEMLIIGLGAGAIAYGVGVAGAAIAHGM